MSHHVWGAFLSLPFQSSTNPDLFNALEGLGQQGEEIAAPLHDVLLGAPKGDALLLEHLRVEPSNPVIRSTRTYFRTSKNIPEKKSKWVKGQTASQDLRILSINKGRDREVTYKLQTNGCVCVCAMDGRVAPIFFTPRRQCTYKALIELTNKLLIIIVREETRMWR